MQPYPMYQPYMNNFQQPMQQYYNDRMAQLQNGYSQPQQQAFQQQVQQSGLNGEFVDSVDVVKAKNVDLSGKVVFYPKADLTEVYTKRLLADGTSQINTYRLVPVTENAAVKQPERPEIDDLGKSIELLRQDVLNGFTGIKTLVETQMSVPESTPARTSRGGSQK